MLGTKCPSITSRWIQSAPAASTAHTSSPSFEKSDARIEGAITRGRGAKEADIGAVFRKLFRMREKRFFGLTCTSVPILTFVPCCRERFYECQNQRNTSKCCLAVQFWI